MKEIFVLSTFNMFGSIIYTNYEFDTYEEAYDFLKTLTTGEKYQIQKVFIP